MKRHVRPCQTLIAVLIAASALVFGTTGHAADIGPGLFGAVEIKAPAIESIPKWVEVLGRIHKEQPQLDACIAADSACSSPGMLNWAKVMRKVKNAAPGEQLNAVNAYVNHFKYITDQANYGVPDYWATPKEFFARSGDCEDYAIAKYVSLRMLGWHDSRLRLVVVQDTIKNVPHAILSAQLSNDPSAPRDSRFIILDNLATQPLSDAYVMQYNPYYAVNESTRWVFVKPQMLDPDQPQLAAGPRTGGSPATPAADR